MLAYVVRNTVNGKHYGGKTEKTFAIRWSQHLRNARGGSKFPLHRAIRKYGPEAFKLLMECKVENKIMLDAAETAFISSFNAKAPHGYNLTNGGEGKSGYKATEETCRKISEALRGKPLSEARRKISEARRGKPLSEAHRRKMSEAHKGKTRSEEHRRNISESLRGERHPQTKLTNAQVRALREEYAFHDDITQKALAAKYNINEDAVGRIVNYNTWKLSEEVAHD